METQANHTLNRFDCLSSINCYYKNMSKSTSVLYTLSPKLIMPLSQQTLDRLSNQAKL